MKKNVLSIAVVLTLILSVTSCKKKASEAETTTVEAPAEVKVTSVKYIADKDASIIEWIGSKPTESHNGTIKLSSGVFNLNDNKIESGSFLIDMASIVVLDIPADKEGNAKLVGHLKNQDFFDVSNHANAAFEVTGVSEAEGKTMLSGNLSIKGIKHNITFPVSVTQSDDKVTLTSESFSIDRTKWDIKYGSKSFFDNLGDKFIKDNIDLKLNIVAKKS